MITMADHMTIRGHQVRCKHPVVAKFQGRWPIEVMLGFYLRSGRIKLPSLADSLAETAASHPYMRGYTEVNARGYVAKPLHSSTRSRSNDMVSINSSRWLITIKHSIISNSRGVGW